MQTEHFTTVRVILPRDGEDDFLKVYEKMQDNVVQRSRLDGKPGWHLLFAFGRSCERKMATLCGGSSCSDAQLMASRCVEKVYGTVRKEILRLLRCDAKGSPALTEIQLSLLHSGWRVVRDGVARSSTNMQVYSTCAFNPNENEKLCSQFLKDVGHVLRIDPDQQSTQLCPHIAQAAIPVEILSLLELPSAVGPRFHVLSKGGGGLGRAPSFHLQFPSKACLRSPFGAMSTTVSATGRPKAY
ncbi:rsmF [Symbiodinium sp. CCMP2456]|nr:rsmF [Symbiodinium sp. CCMP2456]